jgi:hypothetical protein
MTVMEAMRQPASLQSMITLLIGLAMGFAISIGTLVVMGTLMEANGPGKATPAAVDCRPAP